MLIDCDECGNKVSDRAKACPQCGAPVTPPPMLVDCDECGNKVSSQAKACPECGAPTVESPAKEVEHQPPVVSQPSSVPPLSTDLSSLEFRQSRTERTKPSSRIGTVVFLLVAVGVVMFKYVILPDSGGQEARKASVSRSGTQQTAISRSSSVGGNSASVQSSTGSLDLNQFVTCWNRNSSRLDQLSQTSTGFFQSASSVFNVEQIDEGTKRGVHVLFYGRDGGRFVGGTTTAVHCASGLSMSDSHNLIKQLATSASDSEPSWAEFEGVSYLLSYTSPNIASISISRKR